VFKRPPSVECAACAIESPSVCALRRCRQRIAAHSCNVTVPRDRDRNRSINALQAAMGEGFELSSMEDAAKKAVYSSPRPQQGHHPRPHMVEMATTRSSANRSTSIPKSTLLVENQVATGKATKSDIKTATSRRRSLHVQRHRTAA